MIREGGEGCIGAKTLPLTFCRAISQVGQASGLLYQHIKRAGVERKSRKKQKRDDEGLAGIYVIYYHFLKFISSLLTIG